jgi:hypothetical protein
MRKWRRKMEVLNLSDLLIFVLSVVDVLISAARRDWYAVGGWTVAALGYIRLLKWI